MSGRFAEGLRQTAREVVASCRGIAMLTVGNQAGLGAFTNDIAATRRSFVTALFSLPIFVAFHVLDWLTGIGPVDPPRLMVLDFLTFPISWAGFALISVPLVRMLGAEHAMAALHQQPGIGATSRNTCCSSSPPCHPCCMFAADRLGDLRSRGLWLGAMA